MKKDIKRFLVIAIASLMLVSTPVYASEIESIDEPVTAEEQELPEGDGLEGSIIDVADLVSSEENNCQLTISADLPEQFDANIYVQLMNYTDGMIYQYTLYAVNSYSQRGYVPEGEYRMTECRVYGDNNGTFPFVLADDFSMKTGDVKSISIPLENEQAAIEIIESRSHRSGGNQNNNKKNTDFCFTGSEFCVKFNGAGYGRMAITGRQTSAMKLFVRVTKPGKPGNMVVDISLDEGLTVFLKDVKVPYSGMVSLPKTGLTLVFELPKDETDTSFTMGQFEEGDTFLAVIHDPKSGVSYSGKNKGRVKLELIDVDPDISIYDQMVKFNIPKVVIEVIKGGSAGEAVVRYSLDGKTFSDEMIIPFSGRWAIEGTTLSISFSAQSGDLVFETSDSFIAEPFAETQKALFSILIIIILLFGTGALLIWHYFKKQIIPHEIYIIHEYKPIIGTDKS